VAKASLELAEERTLLAEKELKSIEEAPLRNGLGLLCKALRSINEDLSSRLKA
jgi:hypothetical protein